MLDHRFVAWDVSRAMPVSAPLAYGQAALIADEYEFRHNRAFMVVPNPCSIPVTPCCQQPKGMPA